MQELTPRAIGLGLVLSMVMGAANVYLGLKVGMTVTASIPAAVVGTLLLRAIFRGGTILEANQIQTGASAGESLAAGVIFTLPGLVMIGAWSHFEWWRSTLIAIAGGVLGILMMIPMRKVFIIAKNELVYPEGVACATVLQSAYHEGSAAQGASSVITGTALGALFKLATGWTNIFRDSLEVAFFMTPQRVFYFGSDISPALLGVGFIIRWNIALLIFAGGALGWLILIPILGSTATDVKSATEVAWLLWDQKVRYVGVGAMIVAGVTSIVQVRKGLVAAISHIRSRIGARAQSTNPLEEDLSGRTIVAISLAATLLIAWIYHTFTSNVLLTLLATLLMMILSFFVTAVASYIVGLVGSSNSPVSGMTISAVLISGGFIAVLGRFVGITGMDAMTATLGIAAVVCCVACTSGDVCNDLKTGHLLGARPYLQQRMQIIGVLAGAVVMAPVLQLLHEQTQGGIGGRELPAPQATLIANLAKGFFGGGKLPWDMVLLGGVIGILILALDGVLKRRGAIFRLHLMPLAVGIYLPFGITIPMLAGAFLAKLAEDSGQQAEQRLQRGTLLASGMIAGEALTGIALAAVAAFGLERLKLFGDNAWQSTLLSLLAGLALVEIMRRHTSNANRS